MSRAFTPGSSIAEETREKVIEAARKLNYVPNSIASSLTTKRTNIVALILGNMANPFYVQSCTSSASQLQAQGRQVLIFTVDPGAESDDAIMRALQYQIDGDHPDGRATFHADDGDLPRARHSDRAVQPLHPGQRRFGGALRQRRAAAG